MFFRKYIRITMSSTIVIAAASVSGCKTPSTVGEIVFLDDNLRECVTSVYEPSTAVADVVELNCQSAPIATLTGIEWLPQLKIMRLGGPNTITDLKPLAKLAGFSVLSLYGESQELVDVTPLLLAPAFTELFVENGPILDCGGVADLREKLGDNYVITSNGVCQ